jgi:RNA polymerase sigma-70 factor (ECF subfamily)
MITTVNSNSFESKLMDLQGNMLNFALTLTVNKEEAKDLLQETMLRALDNKEKYYENVNFKGWVFTIMHNIFVNNYRRIVRTQTMIDQTDNLYHLNLPQDSGFDTPEGAYTIAEINKAINSFGDEYRIPFSMHVSGFKYEEIAAKLNLPIGTVKSRIFFARKRLQNVLKDYRY